MSLLDRVRVLTDWPAADYRPFLVEGRQMGWVTHQLAERLRDFPEILIADGRGVTLDPRIAGFERRTAAMAFVVRSLVESGHVPRIRGETYPILRDWQETPLFALDRGAVPILGVRSFGVHLNGYVRRADGLHLWVGRRALDKPTAPGKLDHLVAGGQPMGLSLFDNLKKEAHEEAGIEPGLVAGAQAVNVITYRCRFTDGQRDDVLYCYDLELPDGWQPRPLDDEVESFRLLPATEVLRILRETDDFKFNVAGVSIDFLIRHGLVGPEEPGFQEIVWTLHSGGA